MTSLERIALLVAVWALVYVEGVCATPQGEPHAQSVAVYLTRGAFAAEGYHQYDYVLLREPKTEAERSAAEWALGKVRARIGTAAADAGKESTPAFCFLVREMPPEHFDTTWLIEHYDYARAEALLGKIDRTKAMRNVLLVSLSPLLENSVLDTKALELQELKAPERAAPDEVRSADTKNTGRDFLTPKAREEAGYGLYSYVLLGDKVNASNWKLYEAIVGAYLNLDTVQSFEKGGAPKRQLNVTYMPLASDAPQNDVSAAWVLDHYDYAEAQILLAKLFDHPNLSGAFIISYDQPVSTATAIDRQKLLVQDLTGVPSDLAFLWFREFKKQAQERRYWDTNTLGQFMLTMRKQIAVIASAFGDGRTPEEDTHAIIAAKIKMSQ